MLTPEEVRKLLLPPNTDYIITHGVDAYRLFVEDYTYLCVRHHGRLMTGHFREGGRPYTGLRYEWDYDADQLERYTEFKDGYYFGDDAKFYDTGALASYERKDDEEHYRYDWDENGALQAVTEWIRKDQPEYYRKREYDADGRLLSMMISCEIEVKYLPNAAESPYDFTFHENAEFRQIICKAPTGRDFYSEIELDPDGIPVRFAVNPHYTEEKLEKRLKDSSSRCETFNQAKYRFSKFGYGWSGEYKYGSSNYHFNRLEVKMPMHNGLGWGWYGVDGYIRFRNSKQGDSIFAYKSGEQEGKQYVYYPSGNIQETYFLSAGKECFRHIYWHPNGIMREAIVYSHREVMLRVTFDDKGNQLSCQLNSDVFKKAYKK